MSKHEDLIERLRLLDRPSYNEAADALEAQAREIEGLQAQLAATAKSAFEAMPHDIPRRMKRKICVETGWSMSMVSRAYIELRAAFTGEKYTANEDLDAAMSEIEGLRKDAERLDFLASAPEGCVRMDKSGGLCPSYIYWGTSDYYSNAGRNDAGNFIGPTPRSAIDAAKGAPHG